MGCLGSSDILLTHAVSHRCFELQTGNDKDRPYQSDPEALVWQAKEATKKVSLFFWAQISHSSLQCCGAAPTMIL